MPTTTPDPTQIAAEQKVLAPQTMPEERTNQNVLEAGGCSWRDDVVENGYTWNPRVLPYGEVQCVSCACKVNCPKYIFTVHISIMRRPQKLEKIITLMF